MSYKKYIVARSEEDVYSNTNEYKSPILTVSNGRLFFYRASIDLKGKSIEDWLKENPYSLKHNKYDNSKPGSSAIYTYKEGYKVIEVKLGDNEDYFVNVESQYDDTLIQEDLNVAKRISSKIEDIFYNIQPSDKHLCVYSLSLREVIIDSCTEVENQWKKIMRANGYEKERLTTNDYVKLKEFINLDFILILKDRQIEYKFKPYSNWSKSEPTRSIEWYDVYNSIKHNRTSSISKATLRNAIYSFGALFILLKIRYNNKIKNINELNEFFLIENFKNPSIWKVLSEYSYKTESYIPYFTDSSLNESSD